MCRAIPTSAGLASAACPRGSKISLADSFGLPNTPSAGRVGLKAEEMTATAKNSGRQWSPEEEQDAQKHREAASDIWNVREAYLSLLTDIRDQNFSLSDLRARRDELQNQLHAIYRAAPHTNGKAYGEAQDALKNKEDLTFTDAEIDAFLPGPLKRTRAARS
jgi:SMODS and SLOG-associating 2TM effector domain family 4